MKSFCATRRMNPFHGLYKSMAGQVLASPSTVSLVSSSRSNNPHSVFSLIISRSYLPNSRVALVCSARSSHTKALGTTNLLLQASREALQPPSARPTSGTQTPFFPKRVGSGIFGAREREPSGGPKDSVLSSIASLSQLESRSASPSPFTPSGRPRSPPSPKSPNPNGVSESSAFHETVDVIKKGHMEAARNTLKAGPLRDELEDEIERDCESLRSFLYAAQVGQALSYQFRAHLVRSSMRSPREVKTPSLALANDSLVRLWLPLFGTGCVVSPYTRPGN